MLFLHLPSFKRALALGVLGAAIIGAIPVVPAALGQSARASRGASYVLGSGDAIRVTVKDFAEFNVDDVTIPPDGVVSLPFYGTVRVGGRTAAQVQELLRVILLRELKQPRVSVTITKFRDLTIGRVYLAGAVANPGPIDIREGFRLSQLIAVAGGLGGRLEEKSATLTRSGQKPIALNLAQAVAQPNGAANIRLRPDDSLTVRAIAPGRITVAGDVVQGGTFELHRAPQLAQRELGPSPRLSDALLLAGGLKQPGAGAGVLPGRDAPGGALGGGGGGSNSEPGVGGAALSGVANTGFGASAVPTVKVRFTGFLQRAGRRVDLNVEEALRDISGVYNIPLRAGDFITVDAILPPAPIPPIKVFVSGFVARVGSLQVPPGTRLLQAIAEAGGLTRTADRVDASVRRGRSSIAVNLPALQLRADSEANIELEAGDEVRIDEPSIIRVRASGSVASPGELRLPPGSRLLDALTEAGSASIKAEDARVNVLRREEDGSQNLISIRDPAALVQLRSVEENIVLREGDLVNVSPVRLQTVFVQGEVANPGAIEVREGEGLVEVLTRAGGTKESAILSRIAINRNGQSLSVDALDAIKLGKPLAFPMQAGDRVVVAPNEARVAVIEAVAKPGVYTIPERGRLTIADALNLAGGPTQGAKEVVLVRTVNGTSRETRFPLKDVRSGVAGQQVLRANDGLYVPAPGPKRDAKGVIGSILGLLGIFR